MVGATQGHPRYSILETSHHRTALVFEAVGKLPIAYQLVGLFAVTLALFLYEPLCAHLPILKTFDAVLTEPDGFGTMQALPDSYKCVWLPRGMEVGSSTLLLHSVPCRPQAQTCYPAARGD